MAQDDFAKRNDEFLKRIEKAMAEDAKRNARSISQNGTGNQKDDAGLQRQFTQQMTDAPFVDNSPSSIYQQYSDRNHDFKAAAEARYSSSYDPHSGQKADVRLNRGLGADPIRKVSMNESVNHRKYDGNAVRVHVKLQSGVSCENHNTNSNTSTSGGIKLNRGW